MTEVLARPPALKRGAHIAVISPASAPKELLVRRGAERLRSLGYEPVIFPSALASGPLYYAGTAQTRAAEFHAAFRDPAIHAVLCTRGGWGTAELLPLLDAEIVRAHPKPFLGFSDPTTLHLWLQQSCGMVTFYAPMLSPDFARGQAVRDGVDLRSFEAALTQSAPWHLNERDGLRSLRSGRAHGVLFGGCLTLLTESMGTPWALRPPNRDAILFLEEVGTHPYQWDRMMLHLEYAGVLKHVRGIVFGDMEQCLSATEPAGRERERELLESSLMHRLRGFAGPVAIGLRCGHVNTPNVTLPLGVEAELDCGPGSTLRILEGAVR